MVCVINLIDYKNSINFNSSILIFKTDIFLKLKVLTIFLILNEMKLSSNTSYIVIIWLKLCYIIAT